MTRSRVRGARSLRLYLGSVTAAAGALGTLLGRLCRLGRVRQEAQWRENYRRQLLDAEVSALARLNEASQIRDDLVASASHEFRTPLTAIRGSAITLLDRYDALRQSDREQLLTGIVEHADRLGRLLEDMLVAACAAEADKGGIADVAAAVRRLSADRPNAELRIETGPHLNAHIDTVWLDQIVDALCDHLRAQADDEAPVEVRAGWRGHEVAIRVTYTPAQPHGDPARLFEPFASGESARTGRPTSLALYVARRLAEVHGGHVTGHRAEDARVTLAVLLRGVCDGESGGVAVSGGADR